LSIDELVDELHRWEKEYEELQGGNETLEKLIEEKKVLGDLLKKSANELTEKRKIAAEKLSREICAQLAYLDMPSIQLSFALTQEKVTITGMDGVELLISVNKGEEPKPASRIASGGELSRIMLAIKSVLARNRNNDISAMIFDEIDSGISGRAATKVALKLSELSKERQVLCVTHLAQIAAMADNHLLIEKKERDNRTFTSVYPLSDAERKKELARMISGDEDEISLANAERLLSRAYL
jgi:DNA repair protein RecN (Recombination protein N)